MMSFSTMPRWHTIKEGRVEQTDSVQRTLHRVPQCPAWTSWNRSKEYLVALSISFQLTSRKLRVAESEKREKPAELQTALKSQTHQLITDGGITKKPGKKTRSLSNISSSNKCEVLGFTMLQWSTVWIFNFRAVASNSTQSIAKEHHRRRRQRATTYKNLLA